VRVVDESALLAYYRGVLTRVEGRDRHSGKFVNRKQGVR
jgi:hypothetical protein